MEKIWGKEGEKMFSILKKSGNKECKAFLSGTVIPISEVQDDIFAQKVLGDGVAILPADQVLKSPCDGVISTIMKDSFHACGIKMNNGAELLLHIGINTVEMNGNGFRVLVKEGNKVKEGQELIVFDKEKIEQAGYSAITMMVITDMGSARNVQFFDGIDSIAGETVIAKF